MILIYFILLDEENEKKENIKPIEKNSEYFLNDYEEIAKKEIGSEKIKILNQTPTKNPNNNYYSNEKVFYSTPKKSNPEHIHIFNRSDSRNYNSNQKIKKITTVSENDKSSFSIIDEIVKMFINHFSNHSSDFIIDCLKKNSFNLEDSYLQLSKPNEFEGK